VGSPRPDSVAATVDLVVRRKLTPHDNAVQLSTLAFNQLDVDFRPGLVVINRQTTPRLIAVCLAKEFHPIMSETCAICSCQLHREGGYAAPSAHGRSHATKHHHIAERFFGRSTNRKKEVREGIFTVCPWGHEKKSVVLCYDCHEELIHNPVFLLEDIERFAALVKRRGLSEDRKSDDKVKLAGRIRLLREIIDAGLRSVANKEEANQTPSECAETE